MDPAPGSKKDAERGSRDVRLRMTVRTKILLYFFVPALVVLAVIAALIPAANDRAVESLAQERNGEIAALLADQLRGELDGYVDLLDRVAARPEIYRFEPAAQQLALRTFIGSLRDFDAGVVVLDENGGVVAADARLPAQIARDWAQLAFVRDVLDGEGQTVVSNVERLPDGREVVALALPIRVPGQGFRGAIVGLFSAGAAAPNGLQAALARQPAGPGRHMAVVDGAGYVIFPVTARVPAMPLLDGAAEGESPGVRRQDVNSGAMLSVVTPVAETDWRLILEEPRSGLTATYTGATRLLLVLLVLALVAPAVVVSVGADRVTRPVAALTAAVQAAARGELGGQVSVRTGDEFEVLAGQFNEMSSRLAASHGELEGRVAERTAELNWLYEQARETATLAERNRLARELHDSVTQTIFSANLIADVLPRLGEKNPDLAALKLEELRILTAGALAEMRSLLVELRPAALTEADLAELLANLARAAQARGRVPVMFEAGRGGKLPPDVQEAFYRIAQEALNNAIKHAVARNLTVRYDTVDAAGAAGPRLEITDDGAGFDPDAVGGGRFGLQIMRERAAAAGATLVIESHRGRGTRVSLTWQEPP